MPALAKPQEPLQVVPLIPPIIDLIRAPDLPEFDRFWGGRLSCPLWGIPRKMVQMIAHPIRENSIHFRTILRADEA